MKHNALLSFRIVLLTLCLLWGSHVVARPVDPAVALQAAQNLWQRQCATDAGQWTLVESDFSHIYVFECEGKGFVLISKDDCVRPVVGYSPSSTFAKNEMAPNFNAWVTSRNNEIAYCVEHGVEATEEIRAEWDNLLSAESSGPQNAHVTPMLSTTWSQSPYYNALCPSDTGHASGHVVTGCVATASAQIMKYWNWPVRGTGRHCYTHMSYGTLCANFGATTYDWVNMTNSYDSTSTQQEITAVSTLMHHFGVAVEMNYGPHGSGAYTTSYYGMLTACAEKAFSDYFGYKTSVQGIYKADYTRDALWITDLKNELNTMRPIEYSASDSSVGGHAFVCDGYDNRDNMHFNWGWGGYYDGYYSVTAMNPATYAFTFNQQAVIRIEPDSTIKISETALTAAPAGDTLTVFVMPNPSSTNRWQSTCPSWLTLSRTTGRLGSNVDTVFIFASRNNNILSRVGTITFSQDSLSLSLVVRQDGFITVPTDTIHYDCYSSTTRASSFGAGGTMEWGIRIPSNTLKGAIHMLEGMLYVVTPGMYQLRVYKSHDTARTPQQLLDTVTLYVPQTGWTGIPLRTPLTVDTNNAMWVTFYNQGIAYPAAVSAGTNVDGAWDNDAGHWENLIIDYPNNNYCFDYMVRARFQVRDSLPPLRRISAQSLPQGMGYVTGTGQHRESSTAKLTAVPTSGYRFLYWENNDTNHVLTFNVTQDAAFTAFFGVGCHTDTSILADVTRCDQYTWNRINITQSGTYTTTYTNASGCDSIVAVNVTIFPSSRTDTTVSNCYSYWWKGETYTQSGEYMRTHRNQYGCDSILTLRLTIYPRTNDTITHTVCDSMRWNNETFVISRRYSRTFTSSHGCDSIVVLDLTVNHSSRDSLIVDTCDRYEWNGHVYDENITRTQKHTNHWGCDSITTLLLTIHHGTSSEESHTAPESYTWHDSVYTESGDYVIHLTNHWGCDSTVTLHLTIGGSGEGIGSTEAPNVTVYPNPTSCTLTLQSNNPMQQGELYDMAGCRVFLLQDAGAAATMDLTTLPVGIYMLRVTTTNGIVIKKIIKK